MPKYRVDGEFYRLVPAFVWILCTVIVSALLFVSHAAVLQNGHPHRKAAEFIAIGVLIGFAATGLFLRGQRQHWLYRFLDPLPTKKNYVGIFVAGTLLSVVFSRLDEVSEFKDFLEHHGSLFDWVMGSFTVVGIWLTYTTITESQRIIRSFGQLQNRVIEMARDTNLDEELHVLAYTGSLGFLALKEKEWRQLDDALAGLTKRLRIICLEDDDLQLWHNQFIGRTASGGRTVGLADAIAATNASCERTRGGMSRKLKSEMMPGYYLIFNPRRAIIITPFFVPQYPVTIMRAVDPAKVKGVQMFGFETTDQRIIEDVTALFDHHWDSESRLRFSQSTGGANGARADSLAAELASVIKNVPTDSYYRYRSLVAVEKITGPVILEFLRARRSSEAHHLENAESTWRSGKLYLQVPTPAQKTWIDTHCRTLLDEAKRALQLDIEIEVEVTAATP